MVFQAVFKTGGQETPFRPKIGKVKYYNRIGGISTKWVTGHIQIDSGSKTQNSDKNLANIYTNSE